MSRRSRFCTVAAAALSVFIVAEPACHAALAARAGRPRYTAKLSSNPAIRRQQLIVDPEGILGGSASVAYDPAVVRLVDVTDPADFAVTGGFVGVVPDTEGLSTGTGLVPLGPFLNAPPRPDGGRGMAPGEPGSESGFVQVFFDRRPDGSAADPAVRAAAPIAPPAADVSVIPTLPGFVTVDEDGRTGVMDTHALLFEYLPGVPDDQVATYTVFATAPRLGTRPDFIVPADDPANPIPFTDLGRATVNGTLDVPDRQDNGGLGEYPRAVPLPPAAVAGLLTMAGAGGLGAWRRRRGRDRA